MNDGFLNVMLLIFSEILLEEETRILIEIKRTIQKYLVIVYLLLLFVMKRNILQIVGRIRKIFNLKKKSISKNFIQNHEKP